MTAALSILAKDLRIELRTKEAFASAFVFGVLVTVIFNFALDLSPAEAQTQAAAYLWVAFAFSGVLALARSFAIEQQNGCLTALVIAPADGSSIFIGKFLANLIFMLTAELFILPLFAIFFNIDITDRLWLLILVIVLGTVGFCSVGTLFSAIASHTRMREVMLPILLLPATIPLLMAAVESTSYAMGATDSADFWFKLLIVYDIVFLTVSIMIFDAVLEE